MAFNEDAYLKSNPDVGRAVKAGRMGSGYQHYQKYGQKEGREAPVTTTATADQTAQGQLDKMLSRDSPLMQRASTQGKQFANSRGLLNSSMAAGASQGAMIDRATPIAQQDAGFHQDLGKMDRQNFYAQDQMRLGSNLSRQEATQQYNQQRGLNSQQNRLQSGRMRLGSNLSREEAQQAHRQDLERLGATSSANAWGVMANNVTDIVAQGMEGIANIQANPDIKAADKTRMISQITNMRNTDINFQKRLYQNMAGLMKNSGLFPNL